MDDESTRPAADDAEPTYRDPLAPPPEEEEDEGEPSPLRQFMGLFVVPLLVVLACVAVFIGFGWIAYDQSSSRDYLADLHHWSKPRRSQAAYELAKILVADPTALDDSPELKQQVRDTFVAAENDDMKHYLALVLGYTRDPEALPLLLDSLAGGDDEMRIYSLWALGAIGDARALPAMVETASDRDSGIRKTAAFALGELGSPEALPRLEVLLEDPVADVRWNAALAAARLGSDAGLGVLSEMLDRQLVAQVPGITAEQQEDAMIEAVKALAALRAPGSLDLLHRLAEDDPSLKVRQAAIEALKRVAPQDTDRS
jgi:HEAT repeat protein